MLVHLAQGTANKVIASALDCSLAMVKTHLQHIFRKLEVTARPKTLPCCTAPVTDQRVLTVLDVNI
ncbi:LuxR C-terminal-related transcriptional regulator [Pokkaliibacter plantistimulans]|uniref:LuxR C-terminal-related transcriptional regulator n=1 Tax=Pokkaliibacter plantistimulans TaxID=1635171 RepID=UPI001A9C8E98|nr:LuxR C-terminal-related transcriptional regulator [Pokkaliibacter plantistimulans]